MPSAYDRSDFSPPPPAGAARALIFALLVHALLIAALTWGINWKKTDQSSGFEAEIWSAVTQQPAARQVDPIAPAPEPPAPKPEPVPAPEVAAKPPEVKTPEPPPEPEVDIAEAQEKQRKLLEQQKAADAKKALERQQAQALLKKEKEQKAREDAEKRLALDEAKKLEQQKLAKQQQLNKQAQAQAAAAAEKEREANLRRITGMAGATGASADTGTAMRAAGPSASYGGRLRAAIRPNVVFSDEIVGNPMAVVEVRVTSDGTVISQRLTQSSGNKNWDDAAINAIIRTRVMPKDIDGRIPDTILIIEMRARG